ncbi:hypothetical protein [uncultured Gammaproteobacteria bacterium]|nr:hypothetical protein [uncultured Gammaproteobacteria bacterium]CAC9977921.1 hypothetical protein [uncultured Gammaproteobacteria bacterium]
MGLFNLSSLDTTVPQGVSVFLFYALGLSIIPNPKIEIKKTHKPQLV